jgi:ABC-2 type transport system permease protein
VTGGKSAAAALAQKELLLFRRHVLNTVSLTIALSAVFLGLFFGAASIGEDGATLETTLSGLIVAAMTSFLGFFCLNNLPQDLATEAREGTIEQLALSVLGLRGAVLVKVATRTCIYTALTIVVLVVVMAATGQWLDLRPAVTLPVLIATAASAQGLGLVVGGLVLLYKEVGGLLQLLAFVPFGLSIVPRAQLGGLTDFLPLVKGRGLLSDLMIHGADVTSAVVVGELAGVALIGSAYLALGLVAFRFCDRVARRRAVLAHY